VLDQRPLDPARPRIDLDAAEADLEIGRADKGEGGANEVGGGRVGAAEERCGGLGEGRPAKAPDPVPERQCVAREDREHLRVGLTSGTPDPWHA